LAEDILVVRRLLVVDDGRDLARLSQGGLVYETRRELGLLALEEAIEGACGLLKILKGLVVV
jgi:hypothetical protein